MLTKGEADLLKALDGEEIINEPYFSPISGKYIQNYITPLRNNEGVVYAVLAIASDVTSLIKIRIQLEAKNQELQNANAELEAFTYIASHDLQEPLRKIRTFSERIMEKEKEFLSETGKDYFNRIVSAATRMKNLINALFDYSRLKSGELQYSKTNLKDIVEEVKKNLYDVIEEKKAFIDAEELPSLRIEPLQFQQLFS